MVNQPLQPSIHLETDTHGYLKNTQNWNKMIAQAMAEKEGISLSETHWTIITTLRAFYLAHGLLPPLRGLIKLLEGKIPSEKNTSLHLQALFPEGLMRQGSKIAGLPKPVRCI